MKKHFSVLFSLLLFYGCSVEADKCHSYSNETQSKKITICHEILSYEYLEVDYYIGTSHKKVKDFEIIDKLSKKKYDVFIVKEKELYTFIIRYVFQDKRKYNVSFYLSDVRNENKKEAIESFQVYRNEAIYWSRKASFYEVRIPLNLLRFREID